MVGSSLGCLILSSVLGVVVDRLRDGILLPLILKRFFLVLLIPMFTFLLLMLLNPLTRLIGGVLDRVLSSLALPGWFRHSYPRMRVHFHSSTGPNVKL